MGALGTLEMSSGGSDGVVVECGSNGSIIDDGRLLGCDNGGMLL